MTDPNDSLIRRNRDTGSTVGSSVILGIKQNNEGAWEQLVEFYYPIAYRWCRNAGLSEHNAADVCQDVFRSVVQSLENFDRTNDQQSFGAWLRLIVQRRIADFLQHNSHESPQGGTSAMLRFQEIPMEVNHEETGEANQKLLDAIRVVQSEFEVTSWRAFELCVLQQIDADLVARELAISRNSVYLAKSRILKRIRQIMNGTASDE